MRRVVVDTNIWVSALLNRTGAPARVLAALGARRFVLVVSEPLLTELTKVLARPRFHRKYGVTLSDIADLVRLLRSRAEHVTITGGVQLCRDLNDDMVLETALRRRADTLVTRDDDLKGEADLVELLAAAGIAVLAVRRFLALLDEDFTDT